MFSERYKCFINIGSELYWFKKIIPMFLNAKWINNRNPVSTYVGQASVVLIPKNRTLSNT